LVSEHGHHAVNPLFERTDYIWDLQRCQRFLPAFNANSNTVAGVIGMGMAYSTSGTLVYIKFPQTTRVPVSNISFSSASHFIVSTASGGNQPFTGMMINGASGTLEAGSVTTTGASGLVAGNASSFEMFSTSAQLLFTGAEI
jgi:hypothetical protein